MLSDRLLEKELYQVNKLYTETESPFWFSVYYIQEVVQPEWGVVLRKIVAEFQQRTCASIYIYSHSVFHRIWNHNTRILSISNIRNNALSHETHPPVLVSQLATLWASWAHLFKKFLLSQNRDRSDIIADSSTIVTENWIHVSSFIFNEQNTSRVEKLFHTVVASICAHLVLESSDTRHLDRPPTMFSITKMTWWAASIRRL